MNCYRVWMKDGYASLHNATDEADARRQAIQLAKNNCEGCAMSKAEKRKAATVDYVQNLSKGDDR